MSTSSNDGYKLSSILKSIRNTVSPYNTRVEIDVGTREVCAETNQWIASNGRKIAPFPTYNDSRIDLTLATSYFTATHEGDCVYNHQSPAFQRELASCDPPTTAPPQSVVVSLSSLNDCSSLGGSLAYRSSRFAAVAHAHTDGVMAVNMKAELWRGGGSLARFLQTFLPYDTSLRRSQAVLPAPDSPAPAHTTSPVSAGTGLPLATAPLSVSPADLPVRVDADDPYDGRAMLAQLASARPLSDLVSREPVWRQPLVNAHMSLVASDAGGVRAGMGVSASSAARDVVLQYGYCPSENVSYGHIAKRFPRNISVAVSSLWYPALLAPSTTHAHHTLHVAAALTAPRTTPILSHSQRRHWQTRVELYSRPAAPLSVGAPPEKEQPPRQVVVRSSDDTPVSALDSPAFTSGDRVWAVLGANVCTNGTTQTGCEYMWTDRTRLGVSVLWDSRGMLGVGWGIRHE